MLTPSESKALLDRLCGRLGFLLPPLEREALIQEPPREVLAYVKAVYRAEGRDADTSDLDGFRQARDMVQEGFRRAEERRMAGEREG